MTLQMMDDGVNVDDNKSLKMGASSNPNVSRLATLQDRRKTIEETLAKRNQELRQLCLKEAELTGIMPLEMPLEPGESPPTFRRKVGTTFQIPQNLINNINDEEESMASIELQMQVHANMAEAALGLASEANAKTLKRQHMSQYNQHKEQYNILENKLTHRKARMQMSQLSSSPSYNQQQKQKKKPRPSDQEDSVSVNVNMNEMFGKSVLRHSMRSLQHPISTIENTEHRFSSHPKLAYRNSDNSLHTENAPLRHDEALITNFHKLNFKNCVERRDSNSETHVQGQFINSQSNPNIHQQLGMQYSPIPNHIYSQIPPSVNYDMNPQDVHRPLHDYHQYNNNHLIHNQRQASPSASSNSSHKINFPFHTIHGQMNYSQYYNNEQQLHAVNPHQIQPHQQYEYDVMTSGLGGYWKQSENGELVWCNAANIDSIYQNDKRCGSLDRRKNKRLHKRISPNVDPKSATIASVPSYAEPVRSVPVQIQPNVIRSRQDCQLVRTQSLGSVGGQTVDNVWPNDDNSSCGSETHSFNELNTVARKQKQKEWYETSLDDPVSTLRIPRSHSTLPSISPDVKYMESATINLPSPQTPKPILEIPAESNPSPRIQEPNIELFNNNIPKNCMVVQAGQLKPYHEETKPFEMSDFYKYSTKFKKSPVKHDEMKERRKASVGFRQLPSPQLPSPNVQRNLNENFQDDSSVIHKGIYQPLQPMKCQPFSPINNSNLGSIGSPTSLNASLDLSQLTSNVAENFSAEMNAWYQNHEHRIENNNGNRPASRTRSTATLV